MNTLYMLNLRLHIRGPFLTGSGTDARRGLDLIFSRDLSGAPILRASHIKGKFRDALRDLEQIDTEQARNPITKERIRRYLGNEHTKNFGIERGALQFSDFRLADESDGRASQTHTRVRIDTQSGTAQETALFMIEKLVKPGKLSCWTGGVEFLAEDETKAEEIRQHILLGFRWVSQLGAIKSSGYGRLEKVSGELTRSTSLVTFPDNLPPTTQVLNLSLRFLEPLFVGGVTCGTNYKESRQVIPGSSLKGALAEFVNTLCGEKDVRKAIDAENTAVMERFPAFARSFSALRCCHAFPAHHTIQGRPMAMPFSTVMAEGQLWDLALCDVQDDLLIHDQTPPTYQIDWKSVTEERQTDFGWANCQMVNTTRTAIEPVSKTAYEERLYTFQAVSPYDDEETPIPWKAILCVPELEPAEHSAFLAEFQRIFEAGWQRLGKRNAAFELQVEAGEPARLLPQHPQGLLVDDLAIVCLQTDAMLFHAIEAAHPQAPDLDVLYQTYWDDVTEGSCVLQSYFARQTMHGGSPARRAFPYYPYFLTEAGSVFVLKATNPEQARNILARFERRGLPAAGGETWEICPFVPENGYGEITINLMWHWDKQYCDL